MKNTHFLCAVILKEPMLLESILGKTIVEGAWQQLVAQLAPKFGDLFSRYHNVSIKHLTNYQLSAIAEVNENDALFNEQEQKTTILNTGQRFVYEALVDYFGNGSGRKVEFVMLVKLVRGSDKTLSSATLSQWIEEEGVSNKVVTTRVDEQTSPYCDITLSEFTNLLSEKKLQTYIQSIVCLEDERVVGYEILTRGPKGSEVERADKLFGTAAHFGLTRQIELACIEQALPYLPEMPKAHFLTFNVGPEVLASEELRQMLAQPDVVPFYSQIAFELTEHLPIENVEEIKSAVQRLQKEGIKIFLDDTGCGFFDLNTAETLRPSVVKLCISVVRRIDCSDEIKQEVTDTRKRLDSLGAITLGEGVEEPFQAKFLKQAGVQYAQGYLFDKPKPIEQVCF